MFDNKTEKITSSPSTKKKLIYTTNYIARAVSCAFTDDPSNELKEYDVEKASEALAIALNQFFSECSQTKHIFESSFEDLEVNDIDKFKENCILGRSVGLEILGRLLYCTYDRYKQYFNAEKISQMAQLDWLRESNIWEGNVVLSNPSHKNPAKPYKISSNASGIRIAVERAKAKLGWI